MNKYIYIACLIITSNLSASEILVFDKLIHDGSIASHCIKNDAIISGSFDGTIKETVGASTKVIGQHKDWVQKIICIDNKIISASNDGAITLWENDRKVKSIQAHSWWVTDIALTNNKLVSVSLDETIKVWSYPDLILLYSHKIYGSNKHYSLIINKGKAFVGSTRGLIFKLDLKSFNKPSGRIVDRSAKSVLLSSAKSKNHVFFGTSDGFIIKLSASYPYKKLFKIKLSDYSLKALAVNQGFLYAGDNNGDIRKVNIENPKKIHSVSNFKEAVRSLSVNNGHVYAGYDNGYFRILNTKID